MNRARTVLLGLCVCSAAGCAGVVPGSERVVLTREEEAVKGCKEVGYVQSWLSFSFADSRHQLRNRAMKLKGDTVLVSSPFGESAGTAYSCAEKKP